MTKSFLHMKKDGKEQWVSRGGAVEMGLKFKSFRKGNIIGLTMIYPDGRSYNVIFAEVPMDGDWRADVDFYDEIEHAYKKRLHKAFNK